MEDYKIDDWIKFEIDRLHKLLRPSDAMRDLLGQEDYMERALHLIELPCSDLFSYEISNEEILNFKVSNNEKNHINLLLPPIILEQTQVNYLKKNLFSELELIKKNPIFNHQNKAINFTHRTSKFFKLNKRELILSPLWTDGEKKCVGHLTTLASTLLHKHCLIIGGPGSGKSTVTKQIALWYLEGLKNNSNSQSLSNEDKILPVLFSWPKFWKFAKEKEKAAPDLELLFEFCSKNYKDDSLKEFLAWKLKKEELILIGDGIDEIKDDDKTTSDILKFCINWMKDKRYHYPNLRIIITSRPINQAFLEKIKPTKDFKITMLHGLDELTQQELIWKLFNSCDIDNKQRCLDDDIFHDLIRKIPQELKSTPLFLIIVFSLFINNQNTVVESKNSGVLIGNFIKLLIEVWNRQSDSNSEKKFHEIISEKSDDVYSVLSSYALAKFEFHIGLSEFRQEPSLFDFLNKGNMKLKSKVKGDISNYITEHSGILVKNTENDEAFAHRDFRDYLAAQKLINLLIEHSKPFPDYFFSKIEECTEIIKFSASILHSSNRKKEIWDMFILFINSDKKINQQSLGIIISIIITELVLQPETSNPQGMINAYAIPKIKKYLIALLNSEHLILPKDRATISIAIGMLGDNRHGVGKLGNNIPDINWCKIPKGEFTYGSNQNDHEEIEKIFNAQFDTKREQPKSSIEVDDFFISKYPITVIQFECFVDDLEGYSNDEWWNGIKHDSIENWQKTIL